MTHRHRLLLQSACIMLPLALLSVLAAWQLADARKVAEADAEAEIARSLKRIERRLDESFDQLLDHSKHWTEDTIARQLYPLSPLPNPDHDRHKRFLTLLDDPIKLLSELPDLSKGLTPSGLPLEPLIRWRLIELGQTDPESLAAFLRCLTEDQPSLLTPPLLSKIADILPEENPQLSPAISGWEKSEHLRSLIRPLRDAFPSLAIRWLGEEFWIDGRRGGAIFVPKDALTQLASTILSSEASDLPAFLDVSINLTSKDPRSPFEITSKITDNDAILADYHKQRTRHLLLIGLSSIIAVIGWLALCRSHRRQIEISEMKSNFVASVSHELRAPVASICLLAERLRKGKVKDDAKRDEYYHFIEGESQRLSTLVENVLDFSHIEKGIKQYHLAETDLADLTRAAATTMQHRAAENEIEILTSIPDEEISTQVDAHEIHSALVNLLDNAIKFSSKGNPVTIGLDLKSGESQVKLWVRDKGPGIPVAERGKIFERFYRSGSELTRKTQGAGIGLSIVQHIVTGHGGEFTVECPEEGGSLFTITLPDLPSDA
jgi:signal transduction histidine kinase